MFVLVSICNDCGCVYSSHLILVPTHLIKAGDHHVAVEGAVDNVEQSMERVLERGIVIVPKWEHGEIPWFDFLRIIVPRFSWGGDVSFLDGIARSHGFNAKFFEHRLCFGDSREIMRLQGEEEEKSMFYVWAFVNDMRSNLNDGANAALCVLPRTDFRR